MRTSQLYIQDNNGTYTQLYTQRFETIKAVSNKRTPTVRPQQIENPTMRNPKHAAVLADIGIVYDQPLTPIEVATRRAERIAKEKQKTAQAAAVSIPCALSLVKIKVFLDVGQVHCLGSEFFSLLIHCRLTSTKRHIVCDLRFSNGVIKVHLVWDFMSYIIPPDMNQQHYFLTNHKSLPLTNVWNIHVCLICSYAVLIHRIPYTHVHTHINIKTHTIECICAQACVHIRLSSFTIFSFEENRCLRFMLAFT